MQAEAILELIQGNKISKINNVEAREMQEIQIMSCYKIPKK